VCKDNANACKHVALVVLYGDNNVNLLRSLGKDCRAALVTKEVAVRIDMLGAGILLDVCTAIITLAVLVCINVLGAICIAAARGQHKTGCRKREAQNK
jgi:hypothetical protein